MTSSTEFIFSDLQQLSKIIFFSAEAQGLQQLSYANADIGQKLIRTSVTTEPPPPTTKKSSFFGGIRNYFSKKSTESPIETSTTPNVVREITPLTSTTTTTTQRTTPSSENALPALSQTSNNNVVPRINTPSTSSSTPTSTTKTTTTTTSRPRPPQEDFPPLGPPRRQNSVTSSTPSTTTLHSAWATPTTTPNGNGQNVIFQPKQPDPSHIVTPPASPTINIPQIEIASNSELEILTEELFSKESSSLYDKITINYQGRTQSSASTDEAAIP